MKTVFASAAKVVRDALGPRPCSIVSGLATDLLRSRAKLAAENVLLRQQLIMAGWKVKRPVFRQHERTLATLLAAVLPRWRDALLLVKLETVLRWHRQGFRLLWRWKSWSTKPPAPRVSPDLVELIRRMAAEDRLWGAERIRGELLKLGIHVAKRTVQRDMPDRRNPAPPRGQNWHTFLRNHTVWACSISHGRTKGSDSACRPHKWSRREPTQPASSPFPCSGDFIMTIERRRDRADGQE